MGRRKKQEIEGEIENHFDTVARFIKHCFNEHGQVMCIQPRYDEIYTSNGQSYKFTKAVRDDMVESGQVKVVFENDTVVDFIGISL